VRRRFCFLAAILVVIGGGLAAQVPAERLLRAIEEPQNWLMYSGDYAGRRYSPLTQISPANVKNLEMKWIYQGQVLGSWESSPLVVGGVMYVTQRPNDIVALDAKTGRIFWIYKYTGSSDYKVCCGANNRGLAILGDTLFMGTLDAHLVAVDARSGRLLWNVTVGEFSLGYSVSLAPLVVKDKVIVGVGGGEYGIRGFIAAYDAATGKEAWRFNTIPAPGEPGSETWKGDAWKSGGGSLWVTGTYDPALNLTYWGIGNPGPDFNAEQRPGDNLYTPDWRRRRHLESSGTLHAQRSDMQGTRRRCLGCRRTGGALREKVLMLANRNGFVLDRVTGVPAWRRSSVEWASGLRRERAAIRTPQPPASDARSAGRDELASPSQSADWAFYIPSGRTLAACFPGGQLPAGREFHGRRTEPAAAPVRRSLKFRRPPVNTGPTRSHRRVVATIFADRDRKWIVSG
jgi:alcohol dehydrogenase (cytochrome c)